MNIYLPIAEISVNIVFLLGMGAVTGLISGVFGVGGGFITTPLLIFLGIPPAIVVGTQANHLIALSLSGFLTYRRRQAVDIKIGLIMALGGVAGSILGVFGIASFLEHREAMISWLYFTLLTLIGGSMAYDVAFHRRSSSSNETQPWFWLARLPFSMTFPRSRIRISVLIPLAIGVSGGILAALMGIGGGFLIVPAMIYLMGMPSSLVIGTSLFQMALTATITTFLQACVHQTVDIILALFLVSVGVITARYGSRIGGRFSSARLRLMFALLCIVMAVSLAIRQISG